MSFIQPDDYDTFRQLLGTDEVPEKILREYSMRLTMFHKSCNSGPLGSLGIIDLLRFCGFAPAPKVEEVGEVDWDNVKRGQRVEAKYAGNWLAGEFLGFGDNRVLLVKLDEEEYVKECRRHMVRLSDKPKPAPVELPEAEPIDLTALEAEQSGQPQGGELLEHPALTVTDWSTVEVGEEVWTDIDGDTQECRFTKLLPDGQLIVTFDGDPYTVPANKVTRAALSPA